MRKTSQFKRLNYYGLRPQELLWIATHDPRAYRQTFRVGEDAVLGWFKIKTRDGKLHDKNGEIQELLQEKNAKDVLRLTTGFALALGRSWIVRRKEKWYPITSTHLQDPIADAYDDDGDNQDIKVLFNFQHLNATVEPETVTPENYIMLIPFPLDFLSHGLSILEVEREDLQFIWNILRDTAERIRKFQGWPHIKIKNASDTVVQAHKNRLGAFNTLDEIWSSDAMDIDMKGLEGTALNPDVYYKPFIEQISIASGIPLSILRGMESGQLKSGQINLSSYFSVISNVQSLLVKMVEQMVEWVSPGIMKEAVIEWNLEYAISDIDKAAINELKVNMATMLRPHINDKAFARLLRDVGITEADIEEQIVEQPFMGEGLTEGKEGGRFGNVTDEKQNPITEGAGRKKNEGKQTKAKTVTGGN